MSKTLFDTCVFWSCVTRCGCRTTLSTLFTVQATSRPLSKLCWPLQNIYFLPKMFNINETFFGFMQEPIVSGGKQMKRLFYSEAAFLDQRLMWTNRNRLKAVISCGPIQTCGMQPMTKPQMLVCPMGMHVAHQGMEQIDQYLAEIPTNE